jgi:hypothetical protein
MPVAGKAGLVEPLPMPKGPEGPKDPTGQVKCLAATNRGQASAQQAYVESAGSAVDPEARAACTVAARLSPSFVAS